MTAGTSGELDRMAHGVLLAATGGTHAPPAWLRRRLVRGLAGVCLFGRNVVDAEQVRGFVTALREDGAAPLVTLDEEGGDVTRLHHTTGSPVLGALALGVVDDVAVTRRAARRTGRDLAALGVDWDLAPVADVNASPDSPVIGVRSFGADPALVARHVAASVDGLHEAGVLATAKHFPGHGATALDSHTELPRVRDDRATLERVHLPPFAAAVRHGVDAVMLGHLVVEALDPDLPASLSPAAVRLLRHDLGFTGAVVTDALEMRAVADAWTIPGACVAAVAAGADLLCLSGDLHDEDLVEACVAAIVAAVRDGRLPEQRLADAAAAAVSLRERRARLAVAAGGRAADGAAGGRAADGADDDADDRSLRVRGDVRLGDGALDVVVLDPRPNIAAGLVPWHPGAALAAARPGSTVRRLADGDPLAGPFGANLLLVVRDLRRRPAWRAAVEALLRERPDAVVLETGVPVADPGGRGLLCTHGASAASGAAAVRRLLATGGADASPSRDEEGAA